jgi:hypothetical protein
MSEALDSNAPTPLLLDDFDFTLIEGYIKCDFFTIKLSEQPIKTALSYSSDEDGMEFDLNITHELNKKKDQTLKRTRSRDLTTGDSEMKRFRHSKDISGSKPIIKPNELVLKINKQEVVSIPINESLKNKRAFKIPGHDNNISIINVIIYCAINQNGAEILLDKHTNIVLRIINFDILTDKIQSMRYKPGIRIKFDVIRSLQIWFTDVPPINKINGINLKVNPDKYDKIRDIILNLEPK